MTKEIPNRTYQPYATSYLETPLWSRILEPLCLDWKWFQIVIRRCYQLRAFLSPPFRTALLPRLLAGWLASLRYPIPFITDALANLTVGDLVLLTPLIVQVLRGIHYTFVAPSLKLSGSMAASCLYLTYVTSSKSNAPFSFFLGISYERLIGLHFISALCAVVLGCFHGYVAYKFGGDSKYGQAAAALGNTDDTDTTDTDDTASNANLWKFLWDGPTNLTGTVLLSSMMALVLLSSVTMIRRYLYTLWYYLHILLGLAVVGTLFGHGVFSAVFVTVWWALDGLVRYGVVARQTTMAELRLIGGIKQQDQHQPWEPAVELKIKKPPGFHYNAGQFVRIAVPAIRSMEFHPISISSAPHQDMVTLHVRKLGDWTNKLVQLAEQTTQTPVRIEGPYGALSVGLEDDTKYKMVVCVSGGIGVTPCQSIGKDLLWAHRSQGRTLKHLRFVWAVRDMKMVHDIPPLLLEQDPNDNYSTSSTEYNRMMDRSSRHFQNRSSGGGGSGGVSGERIPSGSSRLVDDKSTNKSSAPSASVSRRRRPAVVQADIYCTKSDPRVDIVKAISQGQGQGQGSLPYNIHQGRPDLDQIFEDMKITAVSVGETNIAVIGCGPPALMTALEEACRKHSNSILGIHSSKDGGVFFDLHKERFDL